MKEKIIIFISLVVFITLIPSSCSDDKGIARVYAVDDSNIKDLDRTIEITDSITLQGNDNCTMTICDKCISSGDKIYWADHKTKKIYCFAKDGKYIRTIGERGRATSEYIDINDMEVAENESALKILDDRGILYYSILDGKFIKRQKLSSDNPTEYGRFITVGKDSVLCFSINDEKYSIILDTPNNRVGLREAKRYHFITKMFYSYNNKCRVISDYGEFYIDEYKNGRLSPLYRINLGSKALPDDMRPLRFEEFNIIDNEPKYFKCITYACETSKWLYLQMVGPNQTYYHTFIYKDTGKYIIGKSPGVVVAGVDNDSFYGIVYPEYLPEDSYLRNTIKLNNKKSFNPIFVRFKIDENNI